MKSRWHQWLNSQAQQTPSQRRRKRRSEGAGTAPQPALEHLESRQLLTGDVTGVVFHDANANGTDDPEENGLAGWTVFIDTNGDTKFNAGEVSTVTDVKGRYALLGVPAGNLSIYEIPEVGWSPTAGFSDHQTVNVRDGRETRVKFPNVTAPVFTGQIAGSIFEDTNENGIREAAEDGLEGWTVFVDSNGDGALTDGEPTTTTDTDGDYILASLSTGPATVYEIPVGGLLPTRGGLFPLEGALDHQSVTVTADTTVRASFGNLLPQVGTITGTIWNDQNGDGIQGATELPLSGRTVFIDVNANGAADAAEPVRITDANGGFSFTDIHTGVHRVTEELPAGWIMAEDRTAARTINVVRGVRYALPYPNLIPVEGSISGSVWDDTDGSGLRAPSESGAAGWQVFLDTNNNSTLDAGERSAVTTADGSYSFLNVPYGTTTVRTTIPPAWVGTNPLTGASTFRLLNGENKSAVQFGVREKIGTITGTVWNDLNGDRIQGAGEAGLPDWSVYLDVNHSGLFDAGEPSTQTAADGSYEFTRVPVGTWKVTEVLQEGWSTSEGKTTSALVSVVIGGIHRSDFLNLTPVTGSVSGILWNDQNSNGAQDVTEVGMEGWQVYADTNRNGVMDAGEPAATSDAIGNYTISGVPYGTNTIREIVQSGFTATNRPSGIASVFLLNGEERTGLNFGNHEISDYSISGTAYFDANHNGVLDAGERGLDGITVYLDLNNNGLQESTEPTTVTLADRYYTPGVNEAGTYAFSRLARGTYHVRETVPAELSATPEAAREFTVSVGPASQGGVNFGNTYRANEIHGVVFDDTDSDGSWDASEYARPGVSVYVDMNRNDILDESEPRTVTGDDGSYAFAGLIPGAYIVREHSGTAGPHTYPVNGGGTLWPAGTSNSSSGNVTPSVLTAVLADGQTLTQTISLTLPGAGSSLTSMVDVFLLFDDTGSFAGNSPIVRSAFPSIISTLQTALPGIDLGFGVGRLEEYGGFALESATGRPFTLNQPIVSASTTGFSGSIQAALDRMAPGYGGDTPETDIEALYQLVTGRGFDGNNNGTVSDSGAAGLASTQLAPGSSGDVPDFASFTADPANQVLAPSGNIGGAGFRSGALPIILTATDTGFAYQPKGETVIQGSGGITLPVSALTQASRSTTPFSSGAGIQETVTGLNALGALVIGLGTNAQASLDPRLGLESLAQLTGAVNRSTDTILNGTADPIAPGDPFYFQIASGFAGTVADGIVNAIRNAVTNVAMDITVRASDPRVRIVNHTGTIAGVTGGQTATFDVEFTGDGRPHRFDLQFVREGTDVVLGSIPVVLGTPVAGEGYSYDELEDGEIHHSSHFGNYVANTAPEFVVGINQTVIEDSGPQTVSNWATGISPGPATESRQTVNFLVTTDNPALFSVQPFVSSNGTLTFTSAPDASDTATVTVIARDNGGIGPGGADSSGPQTFVISVTAENDAPVAATDAWSVSESEILSVPASGLLANDTDAEGDVLSAVLVTSPLHGEVILNADGSFIYTPTPGYSGPDSFSYAAQDGSLRSAEAQVTIEVLPVNHVPVAGDDFYSVSEDGVLDLAAPGILANDSDADGNALTVLQIIDPAHGSLIIRPDGSITYTPSANYFGMDSFSYRVNDGRADSGIAVVTLEVVAINDTPIASEDTWAATEDVTLTIAAGGVLANDFDADGNPLTAVRVTDPSHGTLTLNANGSFIYIPHANYNGPDSFVYRATDGTTESGDTVVTINVGAVNDAPVANPESYSIQEDTTLTAGLPGLLGNDVDVDGTSLTAIRVTSPAHGTLTLNANGSFTYVPALNYSGPDSFTYRASDGVLSSSTVTVSLTVTSVNDRPAAAADNYSTDQNVPLSVPARGVLLNDTDADGDVLSAVLLSGPANGALSLNSDGSFVYTPVAGFTGTDSFIYQAADAGGLTAEGTVTINVNAVIPGAKFFVADLDTRSTYLYSSSGSAIGSTALNKSDSKPRGIASNPTGTTQWVVDGSGVVFIYNKDGRLLGQWTLTNIRKPEGVTVWGNDLWVVDPSQDRVFYFAGGAARRSGKAAATSSFALNSGNLDSTDLVSDGAHIWVVNDTLASDRIFRYTNTGALEGSWAVSTSNPSPTGITLDPNNVNHLWVVDASTDRVYQYDSGTTRLSGSQEPGATFALASGNTNPQGIADPLAAGEHSIETPAKVSLGNDSPGMQIQNPATTGRRLHKDGLNASQTGGEQSPTSTPKDRQSPAASVSRVRSERKSDLLKNDFRTTPGEHFEMASDVLEEIQLVDEMFADAGFFGRLEQL